MKALLSKRRFTYETYKLVGFQTKPPSALTNAQQNLISFQLSSWSCSEKNFTRKEGQVRNFNLALNLKSVHFNFTLSMSSDLSYMHSS